eukprot:Nk52_evm2s2426 gene=Nk52_evmTU2s2426
MGLLRLPAISNQTKSASYLRRNSLPFRAYSSHQPLLRHELICAKQHQQRASYSTPASTTSPALDCDVGIIGGGIVGVSTALEIIKRMKGNGLSEGKRVVILEKEGRVACGQTGHNSGVVHAGIYYQPGSLKAKLCVEGMQLAYEYFDKVNARPNGRKIPYKKIGKLIVAVNEEQLPGLKELYRRGLENKCPDLQYLESSDDIRKLEPNIKGVSAIFSPHTGIVDWGLVCEVLADDFVNEGGSVSYNCEVVGLSTDTKSGNESVLVKTKGGSTFRCGHVISCGGVQSDRLASMSAAQFSPRIIPIRGEYLRLKRKDLVNSLIYPVPDARFPFLGVHFTPTINGEVLLGPNAILAFSRDGYNYSDINVKDLYDSLSFSGTWKLFFKHWKFLTREMYQSICLSKQIDELRKYTYTKLNVDDVSKGPSGVRAQALSSDGSMVDDFFFSIQGRVMHVRNAPSPAATSSLAIAREIVSHAESKFDGFLQ